MRHASGALVLLTSCAFRQGSVGVSSDAAIDDPVLHDGPHRVRAGLIAQYRFDESSGATISDTAGSGAPVDLTIGDPTKVTWAAGSLSINGPVTIASQSGVPCRINQQAKGSNALTVEAWSTPALASQTGMNGQFARIVTMSINAGARNFAIGQQGTTWAAQALTTNAAVDVQGSPILSGASVVATTTHLALTLDPLGRRLYVNGMLIVQDSLGGMLSNWVDGYRLALGAEPSQNDSWHGTISLVAIYDRALSDAEIANNFNLGPDAR